ncbi:NAD(P)-dependent oxidoreductase [Paenibacillus sp. FSL R5-0470]|uniref:NAD-dependent epimerase/dehydratase family protein n=1 Tax=Paenibacillus sp. FSL R5-0470 TaxID=2921641 RepID=UPI0030D74319
MKKIVIIGGNASLSKYLIPKLSETHHVITMGRTNCDVYCDLSDNLGSFEIPENTDIVIHVAACAESNTDEELINTENINALGALKACMTASKANVKHFVLISSIYTALDINSSYYSIYSLSKKHAEELSTLYCKSRELPLTIIRPSQIYDAKGDFRKNQPLLYFMADQAEEGKDIAIYGSNDALRNYIHVEDLVEIIRIVIELRYLGEYCCTNPTNNKLSEIAYAAFEAFNYRGNVIFQKDKNDINDNIFINDTSLYQSIGFYPRININDGMKRLSDYRKKEAL